jgi:D-lyxose ketol-isomerase
MKRSEINAVIRQATCEFRKHGWALPPKPRWDVTDFGLGNFRKCGLTLVNLAEEKEYCEKLMFGLKGQVTPIHYHVAKKEDIICRWGRLAIHLVSKKPTIRVKVNGEMRAVSTKRPLVLKAGERITLTQRVAHEFWAATACAVVGEVSTANNDTNDNFFANKNIGRFSKIVEDEKPVVKLVSD